MSNIIQVSPRYQLDRGSHKIIDTESPEVSYDYNDKNAARLIFQDRMEGWFFEPANMLLEKDHTIAAVHIVTPLIEALENYIQGESSRGKSEKYFTESAGKIFPDISDNETAIKLLYRGVRCGFAHEGFLKDDDDAYNIIISSRHARHESKPIIYSDPEMIIYAYPYIKYIRKAYREYYSKLETDTRELSKFFNTWKKQWNMKKRMPIEISGATDRLPS